MPKRSTPFQVLVELLEHQLAPRGAIVTASKLLRDSVTGQNREVDIVIEGTAGIHPMTIGIEVREGGRPASVPWIEAIAKKHEHLPIHRTIVVSDSGFYKTALIKAEALKIDALTVREVKSTDWSARIDAMPFVRIESFRLPQVTSATLIPADHESLEAFRGVNLQEQPVYSPDGKLRGTPDSIVHAYLHRQDVIADIQSKSFTDAATIVDLDVRLPRGTYIEDAVGKRHELLWIKVTAKCRKEVSEVTLKKRGRYRDVATVLASATSFGHAVQMAFAEKEGKEPTVAVRIAKKAPKSEG